MVEGELLIVYAGGQPDATVIAFDRNTGVERWKALPDRPAYSAPIIITAGGTRQAIVWTADHVNALEPATGKLLWQVPYKTTFDEAQVVASPVLHKDRLLCLTAWNRGSFLLKLAADKPGAEVVWKTRSRPSTMWAMSPVRRLREGNSHSWKRWKGTGSGRWSWLAKRCGSWKHLAMPRPNKLAASCETSSNS